MLPQGLQNLLNMLQVFRLSLVVDEDIGESHRISSIILIKVAGAFVKPKGMTSHWKRPSFDLKAVFHTSVCSIGIGGIQTLDQYYWSISPLWVDQGGRRFRESGTSFCLWFYSEHDNQCRVTRFHIFFVPAWLGSYKVMRWDGCAPCGAVVGSVAWSPHSLIKSGSRLTH